VGGGHPCGFANDPQPSDDLAILVEHASVRVYGDTAEGLGGLLAYGERADLGPVEVRGRQQV